MSKDKRSSTLTPQERAALRATAYAQEQAAKELAAAALEAERVAAREEMESPKKRGKKNAEDVA